MTEIRGSPWHRGEPHLFVALSSDQRGPGNQFSERDPRRTRYAFPAVTLL